LSNSPDRRQPGRVRGARPAAVGLAAAIIAQGRPPPQRNCLARTGQRGPWPLLV